YAFCGYSIGLSNNLLYLMAAATLPWALWSADRLLDAPTVARAGATGLLIALVLFAGDSQSFVLTAAAVAVLGIGRHRRGELAKEARALGAALGFALAMSAVQLLPAVFAAGEGAASHRTAENALSWSLHPLLLLEFVVGPIFGGESGSGPS